jgi:hypothetical protein
MVELSRRTKVVDALLSGPEQTSAGYVPGREAVFWFTSYLNVRFGQDTALFKFVYMQQNSWARNNLGRMRWLSFILAMNAIDLQQITICPSIE